MQLLNSAEPELQCPVCGDAVRYKVTQTRKGRPSLMFVCPRDPRHVRGFVNDAQLLSRLCEAATQQEGAPSGR
ncbi:MAG: hypothetical protein ACYC3S_12920 [Chloroflexota bacterium]